MEWRVTLDLPSGTAARQRSARKNQQVLWQEIEMSTVGTWNYYPEQKQTIKHEI